MSRKEDFWTEGKERGGQKEVIVAVGTALAAVD
jgi:hypothetical protein